MCAGTQTLHTLLTVEARAADHTRAITSELYTWLTTEASRLAPLTKQTAQPSPSSLVSPCPVLLRMLACQHSAGSVGIHHPPQRPTSGQFSLHGNRGCQPKTTSALDILRVTGAAAASAYAPLGTLPRQLLGTPHRQTGCCSLSAVVPSHSKLLRQIQNGSRYQTYWAPRCARCVASKPGPLQGGCNVDVGFQSMLLRQVDMASAQGLQALCC